MLSERLSSKIFAARHKIYVRLFSAKSPYILVNEYPKSGGFWLGSLIAESLDLPFRRNSPIRIEPCVTHGHFLKPYGLRNVIILWRDPRDIFVSYYFHCYFINEHNNSLLVRLMKQRLPFEDYSDVKGNLPAFVRHISNTPTSPKFTWPQFAQFWSKRTGIPQTSYEALKANTPEELIKIVFALTGKTISDEKAELVADANSFSKVKAAAQKSAPLGTEVSYIREGSVGGWRKYLTDELEREIERGGYVAPMKKLGYL